MIACGVRLPCASSPENVLHVVPKHFHEAEMGSPACQASAALATGRKKVPRFLQVISGAVVKEFCWRWRTSRSLFACAPPFWQSGLRTIHWWDHADCCRNTVLALIHGLGVRVVLIAWVSRRWRSLASVRRPLLWGFARSAPHKMWRDPPQNLFRGYFVGTIFVVDFVWWFFVVGFCGEFLWRDSVGGLSVVDFVGGFLWGGFARRTCPDPSEFLLLL